MRPDTREVEALDYISSLIYERSRIRLDRGKHALIKARLGKRLRHHGFADLPEYCEFLRDGSSEEEMTCVVDELTTNFTHFLREPEHFQFLIKQIIPRFCELRVWSAACSTGEEPFTIAFYLSEQKVPWSIVASDISTQVLAKAQAAIFAQDRASSLPREWLPRFFQKGIGKWDGYLKVKKDILDRITFRQINLIEDYTHNSSFQVIFCRNVMIYFDRPTQEQLVNRMCRHLVSGGFLLIGHSESLNGLDVPLRCVRPSIYQKP